MKRSIFSSLILVILFSFLPFPVMSQDVPPLTLGLHSYNDEARIRPAVEPLARYLATVLRVPVRIAICRDYSELMRRFISGELVLAILPPYAFVKTEKIFPMKHLANLKMQNRASYRGALIVRRSDKIESIQGLKGKRVGFVSQDSASGYLYPLVHLAREGIKADGFFSSQEFLGSHRAVIKALVDKKIDAGAIFEDEILEFAEAEGGDVSDIGVIARTPEIPFDAFVAQPEIPDELAGRLQGALEKYRLYRNRDKSQEKLSDWVAPDNKLYDSVRETVRYLGEFREKQEKVVRFGVFPRSDVETAMRELSPLLAWLKERTGFTVVPKFSPNYLDVGRRLLVGDTDIAIISPFAYVQTVDRTKLKPMIIGQQSYDGTTRYRSVIVARKELDSLEKLRGRVMAFVDPDSSSGRLLPTVWLRSQGIRLKDHFQRAYFAGNHNQVVEDLRAGKTDAGALAEFVWNKALVEHPELTEKFALLYTSDYLPREAIIARGDLSDDIRKKFTQALLELNGDTRGVEIMTAMKYDGIFAAEDKVYDIIRKIMPELLKP